MKRTGTVTFLTVLVAFFLSAFKPEILNAQAEKQSEKQAEKQTENKTPPPVPPAPCPLEGPSIPDTLKYINDALTAYGDGPESADQIGNFKTEKYSLSTSENKLVLTYHDIQLAGSTRDSWERYISPVYVLDCHGTGLMGSNGAPGYQITFRASARAVTQAVLLGSVGGVGGVWVEDIRPATVGDVFTFTLKTDEDHGNRVIRAMSHLIALLQEQYNQTHSAPNDPFAKP